MVISKIQCPFGLMRQMGVVGLITGSTGFFALAILHGWQYAGSFVLGILLWVLPSCYFANALFRSISKVSSAELLKIFYKAEIIKLLLSAIGAVLILKLLSINILMVVTGYFVSQLVFWVRIMMNNKGGI